MRFSTENGNASFPFWLRASPVALTESHTSSMILTQIAIGIGIGTFVPHVAVFLLFSYPFDPNSDPDPDFDEWSWTRFSNFHRFTLADFPCRH